MKFRVFKYYLLFLFVFLSLWGKAQQYSETELKAAYLYNFTLFVDWPSQTLEKDHFIIGVYKDKEMFMVLTEMLRNKKFHNKPIKIIEVNFEPDFRKTDLLFIGNNVGEKEVISVLKVVNNRPILTVGDEISNFCEEGGIINFSPRFYRKRFEINNEKALSLGLKISSKLLILSKIVNTNENRF